MTASDARSERGCQEETFGMMIPSGVRMGCDRGEYPATAGLFRTAGALSHLRRMGGNRYIGGVNPSRPTLMRLVSNDPSGNGLMKAMILAHRWFYENRDAAIDYLGKELDL